MSKDVFKQTGPSATHKENVKKYMCPQCNKSFNIKSNLKTHILIRTGEKPHKCTMCDFEANRVHHLKMHILKHTGENPHHCVQCEFLTFFGILWHFGIFAKMSNKKSNPIFPILSDFFRLFLTFRLSDSTALIQMLGTWDDPLSSSNFQRISHLGISLRSCLIDPFDQLLRLRIAWIS